MKRPKRSLLNEPLLLGLKAVFLWLTLLIFGTVLICSRPTKKSTYQLLATIIGGGSFSLGLISLTRIAVTLRARGEALKHLPGPSYGFFGIVNALARRDPHRWARDCAEKYGPLFRARIFFFHAVVVTDPALAMHILYSPHFDKFGFAYSFLDPLLAGSSILTGQTDEHWKQVRKGVAPSFSTIHMRDAHQLVADRSLDLVRYLGKEGSAKPQNMDKLLLRESMDVIGEFGFQKQMGALSSLENPAAASERGLADVDVLLGATHEVETRLQSPARLFKFWKAENRFGAYLLKRYRRQVAELLDHIKKSNPRKGSFAQLLLATKYHKTGEPLSDKLMTPEIAALFFAGIDTTGHTGTWLLYMLSQNSEVEAKVAAELDKLELLVTPQRPNPRTLTYGDLAKLEYLQAVVKEVLRMYPPVGIGQLREALSDVTLAGRLKIPSGVIAWIPHYAIQNTSFNWDRPDTFDPERWLIPGTEYAKTLPLDPEWYAGLDLGGMHSNAGVLESSSSDSGSSLRRPKRYFPFAEGPRNCVGQSLAKVSLVATAATLLSNFTFKLADQMGGAAGVRERERYTLITGIEDGMWMHAVPRPSS